MGGKSTTSTQTVSIPPEVMARYNAVNARAEDVAKQPFQPYSGQFVAPLSPTQQQGIYNTSAYSQAAQPYYGAATGLTLAGAQDVGPLTGGQIGRYMDPFVGSVVQPTVQALQQQQGQERSRLTGQQVMSGAFGGDRAGLERANLARQQELATAQTVAPLLSQAYGQAVQTAAGQQGVAASDLARRMQAGQAIAGLGAGAQQAALQGAQAQIGAGTLEQQTQQALDTAKYQQFLQERGYPFQVAQFLANIAMGTGALSGSTTTTTQPSGFFSSDERLKENIEPIGKTFDGQPIYRYNYKGEPATQIGLIAQDVLDRGKPGVAYDKDGYLMVNYRDATDDAAAMASMGGAVSEPGGYERGGYVGGGLVGSEDIKNILAAQAQAFGPFSQAGLYGGQGAGGGTPGATGIVPSAKLPVPKLATASSAPSQQPSGFSQAAKTGESIAGLYKAGKELKKDISEWGKKPESGVAKPAPAGSPTAASTGITPAKGPTIEGAPKQVSDADIASPGLSPTQTASIDESLLSDTGFGGFAAQGGLIVPRHHYDEGGPVDEDATMPYGNDALGNNKDILGDVVKSGSEHIQSLKTPGSPGGGGGGKGGIGSDIMNAAGLIGAGKTLASAGSWAMEALPAFFAAFSDARLKHNIEPVGKTYDGQNIYRYDMGDGRTQLGLMAQEVLKHRPDAVGSRDGYLTVDYDRATDDATPFAYGGLVPRQAHADGEEVIADYSPEADLPAVGAVETQAQAAPDYRAMAIEKAKKYGVNPEHMVKTIEGESSFNPRAIGDEGSSAGLGQFHVAGISKKYPNPGLGDEYFKARRPDLAETLTPQEKIAYLSAPENQEDKLDYMAEHASKKGFGAWTAARNAGLVPGARPTTARGDLPSEGAQEAQYRIPDQSLLESIGEKATSERYLVPALSFLGSMLASKSPFLGGAIGEGLVGGVAGYQSMQKQQMEMAKNLIDVVGNRFERTIDNGQVVYRNKLTDEKVPPGQMQATIYSMFKKAGLNPEQYGIAPPTGPVGPVKESTLLTAAGGDPNAGSVTTTGRVPNISTAEVGGAEKKPGTEGSSNIPAKDISDMDPLELRRYYEEHGTWAPGDDPRNIRAQIAQLMQQEKDAIKIGGKEFLDQAAKYREDRRALEQRLDTLLDKAVSTQMAANAEVQKGRAGQALDLEKNIGARQEARNIALANWQRLGQIYSEIETGRLSDWKAALTSYANDLGLKVDPKRIANAENYDVASKLVMKEIYDSMARENLVRAPAASQKGLSMTVPGPQMITGAPYELIARTVGELNYMRDRDNAYLDQQGAGKEVSPTRFYRQFDTKQGTEALNRNIAKAFNETPAHKNIPREFYDSLYRSYGKYGYTPPGAEEAAKQAAPAGPAIPEPLRGMDGLVYSPSRNQYRDAQGNIYDATGKRVQ